LIAAVVAISIAAGLFYVFGPHRLDGTTVADTPSPASVANTSAAGSASGSSEDPAIAGAAGQPADDESGAAPAAESGTDPDAEEKAAEDGSLPSFDLVRVEPDGAAVIAGRAAPYAELILLHNGEPIGKAKADWAGEWAFVTDQPLPADQHTITILVNDPDAEVTLPQGANPPAEVSDLVNSGSR
jgi:hypothetical protein